MTFRLILSCPVIVFGIYGCFNTLLSRSLGWNDRNNHVTLSTYTEVSKLCGEHHHQKEEKLKQELCGEHHCQQEPTQKLHVSITIKKNQDQEPVKIDDTSMSQECGCHLISTITVRPPLRDLELPHVVFRLND